MTKEQPGCGDMERAREVLGEAADIWRVRDGKKEYLADVVAAALAAVRAETMKQITDLSIQMAVGRAVCENLGYDPDVRWRGNISNEDFPELIAEICEALVRALLPQPKPDTPSTGETE